MKETFTISPVGFVRNKEGGYLLEIQRKYIPALRELDSFSHIHVLWWPHLDEDLPSSEMLIVERPYKNAPSQFGVFATRTPFRPNPIALSTVAVSRLDYAAGLVHLQYIDAADGTPVIDIKPYHPSSDRIKDVTMPSWCSHWPKWYEDSAVFDWQEEFMNAR